MANLLSREAALALVLERVRLLPTETVPVADAAGRFAARAVTAAVDLPPFPSSAMDGYAVRSADTPGRLRVAERIAAGRPAARPVAAGEAMAIATGGVVPEGADAVVPIEYVVEHDNEVEVPEAVAGANVRRRGGDVRAGDVVVESAVRLGAAALGAAAAAGVAEVVCARRPRACVLATGTELQQPGLPLAAGQVYEANSVILQAQLRSAGARVERLRPVADDSDAHVAALRRGLEADVLVTSGGVSVGPHDLVRDAAASLGVEEVFWRVAVRPGKPVSFGVRGATLVFGLPGNPVSSLVAFELFVRPAVRALQHARDPGPPLLPGKLGASLRRGAERDELVRARTRRAAARVILDPVTGQESHMIVRAAAADALVLVPRGDGELPAGADVEYIPLES